MLPTFLVVGAARCGTSWLDPNLRQHPEVYLPLNTSEVHFFDNNYDTGIEWYEKIFQGVQVKAVGEVTPSYHYYKDVAQRIKKHIHDVNMIALLRNPVERAYSHHWNIAANLKRRHEKFDMTFEENCAEQTAHYGRIVCCEPEGCFLKSFGATSFYCFFMMIL